MFIDIIKLGIKDIKKYWVMFCLMAILIVIIFRVIMAVFLSLLFSFREEAVDHIYYDFIPISNEKINSEDICNKLGELYQMGGYCTFMSSYLENQYHCGIWVLLGKYQKDSDNRVLWLLHKDDAQRLSENISIKKISKEQINDKYLKLSYFLADALLDEEMEFFEVGSKDYKHLNDYHLLEYELLDVLENTKFVLEDIEKELHVKFENQLSNPLVNSSLFLKRRWKSNEKEMHFIKFFIFPYVLMNVVAICISFYIFMALLYKKMYREYKIHLICGATKTGVFFRNLVFISCLSVVQFVLNYESEGVKELSEYYYIMLLIFNFALSILVLAVLAGTTLLMLTKENLSHIEGELL